VAPAITTQPASQTVTAGASVSVTVVASGTAPLTYQWRKDGSNISGATSATYSLTNVQTTQAGSYSVVVTNLAGSVTSSAATLTVNPAPVPPVALFSASPTNGTAKLAVTFTDTSTGTITNRFWNFGDGNTLTTTNTSVAYTYTAPGTNTVTLIVSGSGGASTNTKPAYVKVAWYPPGDVDGSGSVTTNDVALINQVITGSLLTNAAVFQATGFANGDVRQDGVINSADSLLIKQVLSGLREYVVTEVMPSSRTSTVPTSVIVCGIGFPTNGVTAVTFGSPINITVSNFTIISDERIQVLVPAGGGLGTGTVNVVASPTNGVTSFGVFINK
jgi:PKD repeat protein